MNQIYLKYKDKVTSFVRWKIKNPSDAEDVVSEVFEKVYSKLDTFDETKSSLSTWIYHITQNTIIDFYRKNKINVEIPDYFEDERINSNCIGNEQNLELLAQSLEKLDEKSRKIIILHYYEGIKFKEIAQKMQISYIYVKVLHKKALNQLKKRFE